MPDTADTTKRRPGRPRTNSDAPMSPAERQAARRHRQLGEVEELRRVVAEQAKEIRRLRELTGSDDESQRVIRNILGASDFPSPAMRLRTMRTGLMSAHSLVRTVEAAMQRIKRPLHDFAIGGKPMGAEVRKEVFADISAIDEAARRAKDVFTGGKNGPPLWMRGERDWS